MERVKKEKKNGNANMSELSALEKVMSVLERGESAMSILKGLTNEEADSLKPLSLLTMKVRSLFHFQRFNIHFFYFNDVFSQISPSSLCI